MSAREEILGRIQVALTDRPAPAAVTRNYDQAGSRPVDVETFVERVLDYHAHVHRLEDGSPIQGAIEAILALRGLHRVVVPDGFPADWEPDVEILREPITASELELADGVLTTCALAIGETGTIVLDAGPGQGRRALTLVPDFHVVVVRTDQVVASVPDAVAALSPTRPLTWISGPSATSDIELNRVEGVHGPRTLDVLLV